MIEPYGQAYGRYTGLGSAVSLDQYQLRPQLNDRFNVSYQKEIWAGIIVDASYFFNWGSRVPYDINLNMADPAFRYEQKTALNTQVPNPFRNYLTPDKFPGQARNTATVTLGSLLVPYPQYGTITQTNTNGRHLKEQMLELRAQRPFTRGISFLVAYVCDKRDAAGVLRRPRALRRAAERRRRGLGVAAAGREQRPRRQPAHRITGAVTWQIPVGRDRAYWSDMPTALDLVLGGWQVTGAGALLLGPPGPLHHQLRGQRRSDARQPDPRSVVRHQRVRGAGHVHAAQQPVDLRRAQRPERVPDRHDADQDRSP